MASSSFVSNFMLVSFVFFSILVVPSFAEKHKKLKIVCSRIEDSQSCMDFMRGDSRTADASSRDLIEVAIDLACNVSKDIHRDLQSFNHYDNQIKDRCNMCARNYEDSTRDIEQAKKLLNNGEYKGVAKEANDAKKRIHECRDQIKDLSPKDSYQLKRRNKQFELLCEVIKVSAKSMSEGSWE